MNNRLESETNHLVMKMIPLKKNGKGHKITFVINRSRFAQSDRRIEHPKYAEELLGYKYLKQRKMDPIRTLLLYKKVSANNTTKPERTSCLFREQVKFFEKKITKNTIQKTSQKLGPLESNQ